MIDINTTVYHIISINNFIKFGQLYSIYIMHFRPLDNEHSRSLIFCLLFEGGCFLREKKRIL